MLDRILIGVVSLVLLVPTGLMLREVVAPTREFHCTSATWEGDRYVPMHCEWRDT